MNKELLFKIITWIYKNDGSFGTRNEWRARFIKFLEELDESQNQQLKSKNDNDLEISIVSNYHGHNITGSLLISEENIRSLSFGEQYLSSIIDDLCNFFKQKGIPLLISEK